MQLRKLLLCLLFAVVLASVPCVKVKSQSIMGTISGTILCGSGCSTAGLSYGEAINVAGNVYAQMSEELDPNTGYALTMCPAVPPGQPSAIGGCTNAQTSFAANANGQYTLELEVGVYTLYVSAKGFPEIVFASNITVYPGQSLSINAYVCTSSGFVNGNCSQTPSAPTPEFPSGQSVITAVGIILALVVITSHKRKNHGVS